MKKSAAKPHDINAKTHDEWEDQWQNHWSKIGTPGYELPTDGEGEDEREFLASTRTLANEMERLERINSEFSRAFRALYPIGPAVTVFGSARFPERHRYYKLACAVGGELARAGFATLTGGGPGIIEAANRGAHEAGGATHGLNIILPQEQGLNPCVDSSIEFRYFFHPQGVPGEILVRLHCDARRTRHARRVVRGCDADPVPKDRPVPAGAHGREILGGHEKVGPRHDEAGRIRAGRTRLCPHHRFAGRGGRTDPPQSAARSEGAAQTHHSHPQLRSSMKITIVGAAGGEVTGSAYYVQSRTAAILVDCGLFQGGKKSESLNRPPTGPKQRLDAVLHHLKANLWKRDTHVLNVGYQGRGSLGRQLVEGADTATIHGDRIAVRTKIHTLDGFSAHAGQTDLLAWFSALVPCHPRVILTHGEDGPHAALAKKIHDQFGLTATLPQMGDVIQL